MCVCVCVLIKKKHGCSSRASSSEDEGFSKPEALTYYCMRPYAANVSGLNLLVKKENCVARRELRHQRTKGSLSLRP